MNKLLVAIVILLIGNYAIAQTGIKVDEANINRTPDASAILDAEATTKGILVPRIALTAKNISAPVVSPAHSLVVFNTTAAGTGTTAVDTGLYYWDTVVSEWVKFITSQDGYIVQDSSEWIDGASVGLTSGNIYARKAMLSGDTTFIDNSGRLRVGQRLTGAVYDNTHSISALNGIITQPNRVSVGDNTPRLTLGYSTAGVIDNEDEAQIINNGVDLQVASRSSQGSSIGFYTTDVDDGPIAQRRMSITDTGFVGVGTSSPSELLELQGGGIQLNDTAGIGFTGAIPRNSAVSADRAKIYYKHDFPNGSNDALIIEKTDGNQVNPDGGVYFINTGNDNIKETALAIRGSGNVGIGTNFPANRLQIGDATEVADALRTGATIIDPDGPFLRIRSNGSNEFYITSPDSTDQGRLYFQRSNLSTNPTMSLVGDRVGVATNDPEHDLDATNAGEIRAGKFYTFSTNHGLETAPGSLVVFSRNPSLAASMQFHVASDTAIYIKGSTANVGIGTTSPVARLNVQKGNARIGNDTSFVAIRYDDVIGSHTGIEMRNATSGSSGGLWIDNTGKLHLGQPTVTTSLSIDLSNENVGIGFPNPTERLDVNGNIRASGNFISGATTLTVPDYVFEKYYKGESNLKADYEFKSLEEIENFTKEKGHLPGIPSAKEIKQTGNFNITQSSLKNLEKIEELYLHIIKLNKEKKELEEKLAKESKRNDRLESKVNKLIKAFDKIEKE